MLGGGFFSPSQKENRMRILMLTDKMELGGAETHIFALCKRLAENGHCLALMSAGGFHSDKLREFGVKVIEAPFDKRSLPTMLKARRILKRYMHLYDVIHAHTRYTAALAARLRGQNRLPKLVTTAHLPFLRRGLGRLTHWGDLTLAVSEDIRRHLIIHYNVRSENILLTRNGIDLSHFKPQKMPGKYIVHTSRIDTGRSKTAFMLVNIAPYLKKSGVADGIIIAGEGDRFDELTKLCDKKNAEIGGTFIKLTGALTDVKDVLLSAKLFVGVSRSLLEAMAMKIPSIASGDEGYGGIISSATAEVLEESNFCARGLGESREERLLADILRLCGSAKLMKASAEAGFFTVCERYSDLSLAKDAETAYRKVLKTRRAVLLGYFGFQNLGDEQILRTATEQLLRRDVMMVNILCKNYTVKRPYENLAYYDRDKLFDIIRSISSSDILILPGGNLLQNETSLCSLIYYSSIVFFARIMGKRVYMLSSGVGRLKGRFANFLARRSIRACDFIGARTECDLSLIKGFSPRGEACIMPDLCFTRKPCLDEKKIPQTERKFFAVIVLRGYTPSADDIRTIESFTRLRAKIIIISRLYDFSYTKELFESEGFFLYTPSELKELNSILSECRFSISSRLHGAIFSLLCGIPCLISTHSIKNRALLSEVKKRCEALGIESPLISFLGNSAADSLRDLTQHGAELAEALTTSEQTYHSSGSPGLAEKILTIASMNEALASDGLIRELSADTTACLDRLFGTPNI